MRKTRHGTLPRITLDTPDSFRLQCHRGTILAHTRVSNMQHTDYLHEWAHVLSAEQDAVEAVDTLSVLVFRLGLTWLALPTQVCKEVAERRAIHTLPHRRGGILLGLVNIRGELQLCIALGQLLGLETDHAPSAVPGPQAYQRLLVIESAGDLWGFPVDEIRGIHHVPLQAVQPQGAAPVATPVPTLASGRIDWQGTAVTYLDADLLFATLRREIV